MIKKFTCIECPRSCALTVHIEGDRCIEVQGNKCPKGAIYAKTEVQNPTRILTGTVFAQGLALKMVPVKTDQPIPKGRVREAAAALKKIRVEKPLDAGGVVVANFLGLGVNLIVTRSVVKL